MVEGPADSPGHGREHLGVLQVEVGYRGGGLRLLDGGDCRIERGLGGRERHFRVVQFGRRNAAVVCGGEAAVVALGALQVRLGHLDLCFGAPNLRIAQIARSEVLLLVDLEEEVAGGDFRAFVKANLLYVAVDLRKDVRGLRRLDMPDILRRRIEHHRPCRRHDNRHGLFAFLRTRMRTRRHKLPSKPTHGDHCRPEHYAIDSL